MFKKQSPEERYAAYCRYCDSIHVKPANFLIWLAIRETILLRS
jgi:hypothetical protein